MAADQDVVEGRQLAEHLGVLERARDTPPRDLMRRQRAQVVAAESDPALRRTVEARDHVEHGRLAGAVGADQREDLPIADLEAEPAQRREAAEADREIFDTEHRLTRT
jgi:hypothetical protein